MINQKSIRFAFWGIVTFIVLMSGAYTFIAAQTNEPGPIVISEFLAANDVGPTDEEGDFSDWIEIYNRSDRPVNLSGWSLSDDPNEPDKWRFPDVTLSSQAYMLIFASGKNRKVTDLNANLHTNFKLAKTDQFLGLYNILDNRFVDVIALQEFGYFRNISYGRYGNDMGYFTDPTPGQPNPDSFIAPENVPAVAFFEAEDTLQGVPQTSDSVSQAVIDSITPNGQLRISEIMYNPSGGDDYEFIELTNVGDTPIDLSGVQFQGVEFTFRYGFPAVPPGASVVVVQNEVAFAERYPNAVISGVFDGQLSNSGEEIVLRDLIGNVVASVSYDDENGWPLSPDGLGDSLVLTNAKGDPNNPRNWQASRQLNGSPSVNNILFRQEAGRVRPIFNLLRK